MPPLQALQSAIASLAAWIIALITATGYVGVAGLMALESAGVPLPSEIIMPFAGYLVSAGRMDLMLAATAGAVGCNLGSIIGYALGKRGGRPMIERYGRWLLMTPGDLDRTERFFQRYGSAAVFLGRLMPGVRSFIAFPAGIARMPLVRFHVYTFLGSWLWCLALAWVGLSLGDRWNKDPRIAELFHKFDLAIVLVFLALGGWFVWHRVRRMRESRAPE